MIEWISLGIASWTLFKVNMRLEEAWQDSLRTVQFAIARLKQDERIPDPVEEFNKGFDQHTVKSLRSMLRRAVRFCLYGAFLTIVRTCMFNN
jgi:hypothetical protein